MMNSLTRNSRFTPITPTFQQTLLIFVDLRKRVVKGVGVVSMDSIPMNNKYLPSMHYFENHLLVNHEIVGLVTIASQQDHLRRP